MKILIMGLPGSGKTTLATELVNLLQDCLWLNADIVREKYNDWDFSYEGRIRQANRIKMLADESNKKYVVCDFVAPLQEMRDIFKADYTIWMDTIQISRYSDTNRIFERPINYDLRIFDKDAEKWANKIAHFFN